MLHAIVLLAVMFQAAPATRPTVVGQWSEPPRRNFSIIYYDDSFLFAERNYGDARDRGGSTEPGLFVHSKKYSSWIQVTEISTADGRFGTSNSDDPEVQKKLRFASVGWNFLSYAARPYIEQPLKTDGSLGFSEKVSYDAKTDRYELRYFTSWGVPSAETVLYIKRQDLLAVFARTSGK